MRCPQGPSSRVERSAPAGPDGQGFVAVSPAVEVGFGWWGLFAGVRLLRPGPVCHFPQWSGTPRSELHRRRVRGRGGVGNRYAGTGSRLLGAVRGGELGSLAAAAGLLGAHHRLHRAAGRHLPLSVQLREPDQPVRDDHRHRDWPGVRPVAQRDRHVGRMRRRHGRGGTGREADPVGLAGASGAGSDPAHRRAHRSAAADRRAGFPGLGDFRGDRRDVEDLPSADHLLGVCNSPNARWCEQRWPRRGSIWASCN